MTKGDGDCRDKLFCCEPGPLDTIVEATWGKLMIGISGKAYIIIEVALAVTALQMGSYYSVRTR